jgi:hypothetical protein
MSAGSDAVPVCQIGGGTERGPGGSANPAEAHVRSRLMARIVLVLRTETGGPLRVEKLSDT